MLKFGLVEKSGNEGLLRQRLRVKIAILLYAHWNRQNFPVVELVGAMEKWRYLQLRTTIFW